MTLLIPKDNPLRSKTHREFVAKLCCIKCHIHPCVAAHIRIGTGGGMGMKPSDVYTVPLCHDCHHHQHQVGEWEFYNGILVHLSEEADRLDYARRWARRLYSVTGNIREGFRLAQNFRHAIR